MFKRSESLAGSISSLVLNNESTPIMSTTTVQEVPTLDKQQQQQPLQQIPKEEQQDREINL